MPAAEPVASGGASVEVLKSPNDKKHYRYFVMDNGLRVLLISDPEMHVDEVSLRTACRLRELQLRSEEVLIILIHPTEAYGHWVHLSSWRSWGPLPCRTGHVIPHNSRPCEAHNLLYPNPSYGHLGLQAAGEGMDVDAGAGTTPPPSKQQQQRKRSRPASGDGRDSVTGAGRGRGRGRKGPGKEEDSDQDTSEDEEEGESGEGEESMSEDGSGSDDEGGSSDGEGESDEGESDEEEEAAGGEEDEEEAEGGRRKKGGGGGGHKAPVKKAAAALAVGVGSFSDPEDLQVRHVVRGLRAGAGVRATRAVQCWDWDGGPRAGKSTVPKEQ